MKSAIAFGLMIVLVSGLFPLQNAFSQFQQGGVDHPGIWYVGEGLKKGDFFSYKLCHVDYKECADFRMDFWIEGEKQVGTETKWHVPTVVYDGNKIVKGYMDLGKIAPEPTGGSPELSVYKGAFKTSIVWLSAFANADDPKKFSAPSWGKIGNIGGEQILPKEILPNGLTVPAGHFDEVIKIGWRTGGANSEVFVVDDFPFPIKASTWTHVSEGIPPQEYRFELLDYKENVTEDPFANIVSTSQLQKAMGCPDVSNLAKAIKKPTKNFQYQVHVFYGPEFPVDGCPMKWQIKFISKYDDTEFLNQVQFDVLVVDKNLKPIRSIAQEEGRLFLYSPSGQAIVDMIVREGPGTANYVVWIYGLAPEGVVPSTTPDYLEVPITIAAAPGSLPKQQTLQIPSWIKNNAGWWADGQIDDNSFVQGIQYMIKEGIMKIPATQQGTGSGSNEIPSWIKNNAKWWADGQIDDNSFVQGIQYMIKEGIIVLS